MTDAEWEQASDVIITAFASFAVDWGLPPYEVIRKMQLGDFLDYVVRKANRPELINAA